MSEGRDTINSINGGGANRECANAYGHDDGSGAIGNGVAEGVLNSDDRLGSEC